jgi:PPM family protein phosphatase
MIPSERTHLQASAATHPGMKGKQNEDRYGVSAHILDLESSLPSTLAIVSDGIGGHRAGEVAAEMAVEIISRQISHSDPSNPQESLKDAVAEASQAIRAEAQSDPSKQGMGATCACAWIIGDRLYTTTVGDSRIYLIRSEMIHQLSIDHTWIHEAIEHGLLTPDEAVGHPNQHVIRRFLGSESPAEADMRLRFDPDDSDEQAESRQGMVLIPGDYLLLCTDGLTDLVDDWEILARLKHPEMDEALAGLIDLANRRGGHDNITLVALRMPEQTALPVTSPLEAGTIPIKVGPPRKRLFSFRTALFSCLGLLSLALLGVLVITAYGWLSFQGDPTATFTPTSVVSTATPTAAQPAGIATVETLPVQPTRVVTGEPRATYTAWPTSTPLILPLVPFVTPGPTLSPTPSGP